uniref:Pterin-binding domain-containing protein n=1 Tax=Kalanchoe fedtschenkoi TaxID=63787 RepID=A0A7N0T5U1_KALFE
MNAIKLSSLLSGYPSSSARKSCRGLYSRLFCSATDTVVQVCSEEQEVVIALGSNVGDRVHNFDEALQLMKRSGVQITRHACLYETAPAYITDQPHFLNSAVRGVTRHGPHELLRVLKKVEKDLGRTDGVRYGPRPIDLDILFYGKLRINSETLIVPHERIWERPFVMAPLMDLIGTEADSDVVVGWHLLSRLSGGLFQRWEKLGGESLVGKEGMKRVLPVGSRLWDWSQRTSVMGVLNITPDSFSDGGKFQTVDAARSQVQKMISEGADIIDFGAQSTRPKATFLSAEEELDRLIPVLEAVRELPDIEDKLISVDTFHSEVASEAVKNGAHIVNDVSAGTLDSKMHGVVASLKVPYIAMHMRGDPSTMQSSENLQYDDVCKQVASELSARVSDAELSGVPAWRVITDPGVGFSKNMQQNLELITGIGNIRDEIARKSVGLSHCPMLLGPSRKRFLGEICGRESAAERDPATIACITAAVLGGADIVRVHNVIDNADAVKVCDAMKALRSSKGQSR